MKPWSFFALAGGAFCLVDDDDLPLISHHKWRLSKETPRHFYAVADIGEKKQFRMHRLLMNPQDGLYVDHINGNGLDNRRFNLRSCTNSQNQANSVRGGGSSPFKGVCWNKNVAKWQARISHGGRVRYLGLFEDEVLAARTYDRAAIELFGEFARTNFPFPIIEGM